MIRLSGKLRSCLIIGIQGIRARKLRTFLAMVSLFLGVLAVVIVQAGAEMARQAALANVELTEGKDGTLVMYMPPMPEAITASLESVRDRSDAVLSTEVSAIIGEPGVTPVNPGGAPFDFPGGPRFDGGGGSFVQCDERGCYEVDLRQAAPKGQAIELRLSAMTGDVRQFRPFRPEAGQWLDFSSPASLAPRIVLNREAAKGFTRHSVPAEMSVTGATANVTPLIIGVVDDGQQQPVAYVRMDELLNWLPQTELNRGGLRMLLSPEAADVVQIIQSRLQALGVPAEQFRAEPVRSKEMVDAQLTLIQMIFLGMAALVLLIGVAGILNVGLATVGERIEEFALRRAVGTPRLLLAGIVLAETMLTGLLTAAAAIGVAAVGVQYGGRFAGDILPYGAGLQFPWQASVAGIAAGIAAGVLGGLVPAIRAARIPIATVMRA